MSDIPITPGLLDAGFPAHSQSAWLEWIATVDHKRIGILYLAYDALLLLSRRHRSAY